MARQEPRPPETQHHAASVDPVNNTVRLLLRDGSFFRGAKDDYSPKAVHLTQSSQTVILAARCPFAERKVPLLNPDKDPEIAIVTFPAN